MRRPCFFHLAEGGVGYAPLELDTYWRNTVLGSKFILRAYASRGIRKKRHLSKRKKKVCGCFVF